jgi:hypothetical protein
MLCALAYFAEVSRAKPESRISYDCEGDACSVVTLTDTSLFRRKNGNLEVKTFNGPYHASYEEGCFAFALETQDWTDMRNGSVK